MKESRFEGSWCRDTHGFFIIKDEITDAYIFLFQYDEKETLHYVAVLDYIRPKACGHLCEYGQNENCCMCVKYSGNHCGICRERK